MRFAVTLGLKLAPDTAAAMQKLARLCSVEEGAPPAGLGGGAVLASLPVHSMQFHDQLTTPHGVCLQLTGLPPRRLWLELHKLNKAEAGAPGTWAAAMKLAYHLGLLRAMMPWLRVSSCRAPSRQLLSSAHGGSCEPAAVATGQHSCLLWVFLSVAVLRSERGGRACR